MTEKIEKKIEAKRNKIAKLQSVTDDKINILTAEIGKLKNIIDETKRSKFITKYLHKFIKLQSENENDITFIKDIINDPTYGDYTLIGENYFYSDYNFGSIIGTVQENTDYEAEFEIVDEQKFNEIKSVVLEKINNK